jgi:uncharacterized lipoprotein YbaY
MFLLAFRLWAIVIALAVSASSVEASILVHDQLRFTNDTAYLVLTQGHPAKVDYALVEGDAPAGTKP